MEIFWYGHSCFRLVERGKASVVTETEILINEIIYFLRRYFQAVIIFIAD